MDDCIEWTKCTRNGYGADGKRYAHRQAYIRTYGPIPNGLCVLHKCDNRRCINPEHLFLGTKKDNTHDMMKKNRGHWTSGEDRSTAKLNWEKVIEIRLDVKSSQRVLAKKYGVSGTTIFKIIHNKKWRTNGV